MAPGIIQMNRYNITGLCGFALCLYLLLIFRIGTQPFSDFQFYYDLAIGIIQGHAISDFARYFQPAGYPYLLSLLFRVGPTSILIPQVMNALMMAILIGVYLACPYIESSASLMWGYLALVFNVNYLSMVTVLGSEIPYVFFLLIGLYLFGRGFKGLVQKGPLMHWKRYLFFLFAGLLFGMSQFIRPVTFPFLFLLSFFILLGLRYFTLLENAKEQSSLFKRSVFSLSLTWLCFFLGTVLLYGGAGYGMSYVPKQKGLWNLYVGFNAESRGAWNLKDAELITQLGERYHWDGDKINGDFQPMVYDRVKKNWIKNLQILPEKLYHLLTPRGIPFWAIEQSRVQDKEKIYGLSNYFCWMNVLVLTISIWAWVNCLGRKDKSWGEYFAFSALGASFLYLIVHAYFLEVQGRYSNHLWMIMFIFIPVSLRILRESLVRDKSARSPVGQT